MKTVSVIIVIVLLLTGCATTPVSSTEATQIAPAKQLAYKQPSPGTAPVSVIRDSGWAGAACDAKILIDGKVAAYLATSETVTLHIPAGEIIIGMEPTCGAAGLVEQSTLLTAGKPKYFRVSFDSNSSPLLQPTIAR